MTERSLILTLACEAVPGIIAAVTAELAGRGANIAETAQFWDRDSNRFFLRIAFLVAPDAEPRDYEAALAPAAERFGMELGIADSARLPKIIIMVSKFDHALLHLLYQVRIGWLRAEVAAIVSNHADARVVAEHHGIPFHHWPVTRDTKAEVEDRLIGLVEETGAELVVLARYMQVLSDRLSQHLLGRSSTSTTPFCRASRVPSPIIRRTSGG